jgi:predicted transcriptional regulator
MAILFFAWTSGSKPKGKWRVSYLMDAEHSKYRSRLEIIRDILLLIAEKKASKKTHIMYGANLSYELLTICLEETMKNGFIEYDGDSEYKITKQGEQYLSLFEDYERSQAAIEERFKHLMNDEVVLKKMTSHQQHGE